MVTYYVNVLKNPKIRHYRTHTFNCKDINELRKRILKSGMLDNAGEIEVWAGDRMVGLFSLMFIKNPHNLTSVAPYTFAKDGRPVYAVWVNTTSSKWVNRWYAVKPSGRLDDWGYAFADTPEYLTYYNTGRPRSCPSIRSPSSAPNRTRPIP